MPPKAEFSYGGVAALASATGMGRAADCLDRLLDHLILDNELDLHLGQEVDDVLGAAIELGMALLPSEPLGFQDGDALEPDLVQRVLHFVELEALDDRFDLLHWLEISPHADAGAAGRGNPHAPEAAVSMPYFFTVRGRELTMELIVAWAR